MEISWSFEVGVLMIIGAIVVLCVTIVNLTIKATDQRIARVEKKVDLILDHFGLRNVDQELQQVVTLLREGKKINAIKVYREITGVGLKEAKTAVERML